MKPLEQQFIDIAKKHKDAWLDIDPAQSEHTSLNRHMEAAISECLALHALNWQAANETLRHERDLAKDELAEAKEAWAKEREELELKADMAGYESNVYLRGQDDGVAGVVGRWREALNDPYPKPGVMNEPLESLYRHTENLRAELVQLNFALGLARKDRERLNWLEKNANFIEVGHGDISPDRASIDSAVSDSARQREKEEGL